MKYSKLIVPMSLAAALLTACGGSDDHHRKVNQIPKADAATVTASADNEYKGKLAGSDGDNDKLTFAVATAPTKGTVKIEADGSYSYVPNAEFTGSDTFTYTVSDGKNTSNPAEVKITVDLQQVSFNEYSRKAFNQMATDKPLPLNSRIVTQDVTAANAYDDLLSK